MRLWTLVRGPAAACFALFLVSVGHAENPADFYKGKNVDLYIGYSAGGGYDLYATASTPHGPPHRGQSRDRAEEHAGRRQPGARQLAL